MDLNNEQVDTNDNNQNTSVMDKVTNLTNVIYGLTDCINDIQTKLEDNISRQQILTNSLQFLKKLLNQANDELMTYKFHQQSLLDEHNTPIV